MFIIDAVSAETRGQTALPSPGDSFALALAVGAAARTKLEIMFL